MEQEIANYNHFNTISHKDIIKRLLSLNILSFSSLIFVFRRISLRFA